MAPASYQYRLPWRLAASCPSSLHPFLARNTCQMVNGHLGRLTRCASSPAGWSLAYPRVVGCQAGSGGLSGRSTKHPCRGGPSPLWGKKKFYHSPRCRHPFSRETKRNLKFNRWMEHSTIFLQSDPFTERGRGWSCFHDTTLPGTLPACKETSRQGAGVHAKQLHNTAQLHSYLSFQNLRFIGRNNTYTVMR